MDSTSDDSLRHEAALTLARGEAREAVNQVIGRINETSGQCSPRVWLMAMDLYRSNGTQPAYEKLALLFSQRLGLSAPAWESQEKPQANTDGFWRNALIIEGSPRAIDDEKIRDWLRTSKETKESRLDLSRMRLEASDDSARPEIARLVEMMTRLRRICPHVLLMGEAELTARLDRHLEGAGGDLGQEQPWYDLRLELHQWRGESERHDDLADLMARRFGYCPIGFDAAGAVAAQKSPEQPAPAPDASGALEGEAHAATPATWTDHVSRQWSAGEDARINLKWTRRVEDTVARELAGLLMAQHGIGDPGAPAPAPDKLPRGQRLYLLNVSEHLVALFETTGVAAYAVVESRHEKLLTMLARQAG